MGYILHFRSKLQPETLSPDSQTVYKGRARLKDSSPCRRILETSTTYRLYRNVPVLVALGFIGFRVYVSVGVKG